MWNRWVVAVLLFSGFLFPMLAYAVDEEGCLICHRHSLRKASLEGEADLRVWDAPGGPHESLHCSDCHPDAKAAPHILSTGTANCIGECHSSSQGAAETHRAASFGGLNEGHRKISAPRAPCLLCHRAEDRSADLKTVADRCSGCHPGEKDSVEKGVHARIRGQWGDGMCAGCHRAHKTTAKSQMIPFGKVNCGGKECHASVSDGMKRLGGHGSGSDPGRKAGKAAAGGVFLAIAALGAVSSRILCRDGQGRKDL